MVFTMTSKPQRNQCTIPSPPSVLPMATFSSSPFLYRVPQPTATWARKEVPEVFDESFSSSNKSSTSSSTHNIRHDPYQSTFDATLLTAQPADIHQQRPVTEGQYLIQRVQTTCHRIQFINHHYLEYLNHSDYIKKKKYLVLIPCIAWSVGMTHVASQLIFEHPLLWIQPLMVAAKWAILVSWSLFVGGFGPYWVGPLIIAAFVLLFGISEGIYDGLRYVKGRRHWGRQKVCTGSHLVWRDQSQHLILARWTDLTQVEAQSDDMVFIV
ncbi:hypothetical protein BT63DRAFT_145272 [Microthyrium microscopicum]|uniref:Uncharacterized protein n=1 Tax=Microthyrium microscopicum TaxID=703497 RepID=A0A6A6UML9_9PEZI|nr:hypothetical protein BT63DRAFT_145272 [Microthyrium microscopicum]